MAETDEWLRGALEFILVSPAIVTAMIFKSTVGSGRLAMADYQAFAVGSDGRFVLYEPLICENDDDAVAKAQRLVDSHDIELWSGSGLVIRLTKKRGKCHRIKWEAAMNRRSSVAEIMPRGDIAKSYRRLMRLRRMVKQAESLQALLDKPAPSSSRINARRRHQA
jgi:hypothetical protein